MEQKKDEIFELDVKVEEIIEMIDDDQESPIVDATQTANESEQLLETKAINDPLTNKSAISQLIEFSHDEQTELKVDEAPVVPSLIFPVTFLNPEIKIQLGSFGIQEKEPVSNGEETGPTLGANSKDQEIILDDKATGQEVKDMNNSQRDEVPTSFVESSSEVIEADVPPYQFFLISVPRFEDENLSEQIQEARLQLDEKIKHRKAIGAEVLLKKAILKAHYEAFKTANSKVIAAMKFKKSKSPEIQHIQSLIEIYKVKNVLEDEEIDNKKHTADDIIEARNQKKEIIERLENLVLEMDSLNENVSKAEAAELAIMKMHDEENEKAIELQAQFKAAEEDCQQADKYLNSLKKRLYDKNEIYLKYKKVATAARNLASGEDKNALDRLCLDQVENFMEEWNRNNEFRKEYTSRIRPSSPDETSCVSDISKKDVTNSVPIKESVSVVSRVEQGKKTDSSLGYQTDENLRVSDMSKRDATDSVSIMETVEQGEKTVSSPDYKSDETLLVSDMSKRDATNSVSIMETAEEGEKTVSSPDYKSDETLPVSDMSKRDATDSVSVMEILEQGEKTVSSPDYRSDETFCVSNMSKSDATNSVSIMETVEQGEKTVSSPDYKYDETLRVSDVSKRDATNSVSIMEPVEQGENTVSSLDSKSDETLRASDTSKRDGTNSVSIMETLEHGKTTVSSPDNQAMEKVVHITNHKMKTREPITFIVRDSKFVSVNEMIEDKEKEKTMMEVDIKEDELTKEEIECKKKEQIRLEEKRKLKKERLQAEKAQKRAQLEALKEAELKEQTREKRSERKKRKRTGGGNTSTSTSSSINMNDENNEKPGEANDEINEKPSEANETEETNPKPQAVSLSRPWSWYIKLKERFIVF